MWKNSLSGVPNRTFWAWKNPSNPTVGPTRISSLTSRASGKIISFIVRDDDGSSEWDTIRDNDIWNIVVTRTRSGGVLSNMDGTFNMEASGDTEFHLWLADNGNFGVAPEKFDVFPAFEDGRLLKNSVTK